MESRDEFSPPLTILQSGLDVFPVDRPNKNWVRES